MVLETSNQAGNATELVTIVQKMAQFNSDRDLSPGTPVPDRVIISLRDHVLTPNPTDRNLTFAPTLIDDGLRFERGSIGQLDSLHATQNPDLVHAALDSLLPLAQAEGDTSLIIPLLLRRGHELTMACTCVSCYITSTSHGSRCLFERMTCMENKRLIF